MGGRDVKRQAVVIIHGIGEQRPMDTLRGFVKALSGFDHKDGNRVIWSKPDSVSTGFEHRMLTLAGTSYRPQTDVYELYWAHLADTNEEPTFFGWLIGLFKRNPMLMPERFRKMRRIGTIIFFISLISATIIAWVFPVGTLYAKITALPVVAFILAIIGHKATATFRGTVADISRYFDPHPKNIKARNEVRALGVEFLEKLHQSRRSYDRIIVCGHSLGSAIGYDILQHLWYRMHEEHAPIDRPDRSAKRALHEAIKEQEWDAIPDLQSRVFEEQKESGNPWRITDFVTLGSPLTHADLILAESETAFNERLDAGELSACPPRLEPRSKKLGFLRKYQIKGGDYRSIELLNHRSVFAVTRWTNIYFPVRMGFLGDPVAGPLAPIFGKGIVDIKVDYPEQRTGFRHLDYWRLDIPEPVNSTQGIARPLAALSQALHLDRKKPKPETVNEDT